MKIYGTTRAQAGKCWENQHHNLQCSLPLPINQPSVFGYKLLQPQLCTSKPGIIAITFLHAKMPVLQ